METPWLHEKQTWRGYWWLPEDPSNRHAGFLTYDPGSGIELVLVGGFDAQVRREIGPGAWAVLAETKDFPVVHGRAGNRDITLFGAYSANSLTYNLGFFEGGPSEQTLRAQTALVGVHADTPDGAFFDHANCVIEDTWLWSATSALEATWGWDKERQRPTGEATIRMSPVEEQTVMVEGATITLAHWLTLPAFDTMRGGSRARVEHKPVLSIRTDQPASFASLMTYVATLQDLLSLATGRGPALLWMKVYLPRLDPSEAAPTMAREVDVYTRRRGEGDPNAKAADARTMVFTLDDLAFTDAVSRWWQVHEKFRASCNMIVGGRYVADHYVETMLIVAVAAAESFHRDLEEKPATTREENLERLRPALDALEVADRKWLESFVPSGFSLGQRLERLAQRLPEPCRTRLLPNPVAWAAAAKRARHNLSHSGKSSEDATKLYATVQVTRAVVLLNILLELGLSEARLLKALSDNGELSHACSLATTHFPAAPGKASQTQPVE
jgi:hypothetical protein